MFLVKIKREVINFFEVYQIKFEFFIFSEWEFNMIFIIIHNIRFNLYQHWDIVLTAHNNKTKYETRNAIRSEIYLDVWNIKTYVLESKPAENVRYHAYGFS